jgi:superfamily II DNA/RNA helicase
MKQAHQTVFVSATISAEIEKLARQYMRDPVRLELAASKSLTVSQVKQSYFSVQPWDKNRLLVHLLKHEDPALTIVFCRTKHTVDALTEYLNRHDIDAHSMHGDMYQNKRNRVMQKLRSGELSVLVASDLAARGLDVDDISHVINYDLPEDPEVYVHRIGRTARAGRNGIAWAFVTPDQGELLTGIEMLTNVEIPSAEYADFAPGPVPASVAAEREKAAARSAALREELSRKPMTPPGPEAEKDTSKFPGGLVPASLPPKRMGGKMRTRRR